VPLVSKLFGAAQDSDTRTEIVLLITPHIVRNVELPGVGLQEFMAGTDVSVGAAPIQLGAPGALGAPPPSAWPVPGAMPAPGQPAVTPPVYTPPPVFTPPPMVPTSPGVPSSEAPKESPKSGGSVPAKATGG
jgi:general secretion pathway protein D